MRNKEECLRQAERCEQYAHTAQNYVIQSMFLQVGTTWRRMGQAAEQTVRDVLQPGVQETIT